MELKFSMSSDVADLLLNAHTKSDYQGKRYYFSGDLNQMSIASSVARKLGIEVSIEGGIPFVKSQADYDEVTNYLVANMMEGWHHYVSHERYCDIKGEYCFGEHKIEKKAELERAANELGITLFVKDNGLQYVTDREEYNMIVQRINDKMASSENDVTGPVLTK